MGNAAGGSSSVSSDSQPPPGSSGSSRARSRSLTATSPSLTGEVSSPLGQHLKAPRAAPHPPSPASRITASSGARSVTGSLPGNGAPLEPQRRRIGAVAEFEIVGGRECAENVGQMSSDGDLAHRVSALAVLDPEAGGAAAVGTSHYVPAHANQVGHVKTVVDVGDQILGTLSPRLHVQIARAGRGHRRYATAGMTGGGEPELARRGTVEQPGAQHAVIDQGEPPMRDAFAVEWMRAKAPLAQRIVNDADAVVEQLGAPLIAQEASFARDRGTIGGAGQMRHQRARDARVEDDRHLTRGNLARIEPFDCPLAGGAADLLRAIEVSGVER